MRNNRTTVKNSKATRAYRRRQQTDGPQFRNPDYTPFRGYCHGKGGVSTRVRRLRP